MEDAKRRLVLENAEERWAIAGMELALKEESGFVSPEALKLANEALFFVKVQKTAFQTYKEIGLNDSIGHKLEEAKIQPHQFMFIRRVEFFFFGFTQEEADQLVERRNAQWNEQYLLKRERNFD